MVLLPIFILHTYGRLLSFIITLNFQTLFPLTVLVLALFSRRRFFRAAPSRPNYSFHLCPFSLFPLDFITQNGASSNHIITSCVAEAAGG